MKKITNNKIKKRLLVLVLLVTFIFTALIGRLFYLQVSSASFLQGKAMEQWLRDLPLSAQRGVIYDANGVVLADNNSCFDLYVRPNALRDKEKVAEKISKVLEKDYDKILTKISKKGTSEITVAKKIPKEKMIEIDAENFKGVYFAVASKRIYPYGDFMSQILGFTNADNLGQSGIEKFYNDILMGVDGKIFTETDLIGKELEGSGLSYLPSINGLNAYLTVDYHIQSFAEKAVKEAVMKYSAKGATCLVMNPKNGEIYAMAQAPSIDLNNPPRDDLDLLFDSSKNKLVSGVYEPGSTFKILTSAIGLEENAFPDSHRFYCPGYRTIDGNRIRCWRSIGHGSQTFGEGVANSCNCVFMDIATRVGVNKTYDYFRKFGLFEKTGIDVVGETSSIVLNQKTVKPVDIARIGFGQAIAVTPIQLARSVSAVINGGYLPTPHILKEVRDNDGKTVLQNIKPNGNQIISTQTSDLMRKYLENVVVSGGGKNAYVNGFSIGGKTGTAQKYSNGSIASGKYISSFIGFSSVENPEYLCLFIVDEPQGYVYYGSLVAAPYVKNIFSSIFAYKNIKPNYKDGESDEKFIMPDLTGLTLGEATAILKKLGINYEYGGSGGNIIYQVPAPNSENSKNTVAFVQLSQA